MREKRSIRFGKWALKVAVCYAVFIAVGQLLSLVPASRLGVSQEVFYNLRMCFMLLGPVYLTLCAKILLTCLAAAKGQEKDIAQKSRGVLFAATALLLFANLSNAETISDLTAGYIQGKGLRNLEKSKRYPRKAKRFLNVFLPVGFYLLILELLTLLACIIAFAPLSQAASNAFIFTIALTALLLFLIPLILSLVCGYQGDKAEHQDRRAQQKQAAIQSDALVLESDPARRKKYLRLPKILALLVCPGVCLVSGLVLALTRDSQYLLAVRLLRAPFLALMATALFSFLPLLLYWMNCSGTSLVQRVYLVQNQLYYTGYSGSMEERVEFSFTLLQLKGYRVENGPSISAGSLPKKQKTPMEPGNRPFFQNIVAPPHFPAEQEQALLQFLENKTAKVY